MVQESLQVKCTCSAYDTGKKITEAGSNTGQHIAEAGKQCTWWGATSKAVQQRAKAQKESIKASIP